MMKKMMKDYDLSLFRVGKKGSLKVLIWVMLHSGKDNFFPKEREESPS